MRPTRQLSCLLLREGEKLCNIFFCAVCTIWGCSVCFIRSFSLLRERKYGASEASTTERATASDGSNPLCPLLPFQTANALLVCGLEPGGFRFPSDFVRIKAYETKPCAAKLLILSLCSACDADHRPGLHCRNRFGFLRSFPQGLDAQCESVLHNKFCWQYGFFAPMKLQLLSNLIPK